MEENMEVTTEQEAPIQEVTPEVTEPSTAPEPIKPNYERAAAKYGHKNIDDWVKSGRDPDEWIPAEDFIKNYTWSREIKKLKDIVEDKTKAIEGLMEFNKKIEEKSYQRAYEDLQRKLEDAAAIGDTNTVKAVNKEIINLEVEKSKATIPEKPAVNNQVPDFVNDFISRNYQWYNNNTPLNSAMQTYAISRERELMAQNAGMDPRLILRMVEDDVKKTYPSQFSEKVTIPVTTPQTSTVEAGVNRPMKTSKEITLKDLPIEDQEFAARLKRTTKSFDEKAFINDFKKIHGIR